MEAEKSQSQNASLILMQRSIGWLNMHLKGDKLEAFTQIVVDSKPVTIEKVVAPETLSFNQLKARHSVGHYDILKFITGYLDVTFNGCFNLDKNLTGQQLIAFAEEILDDESLTVEDIICFCNGVRWGLYGKVYNRIDLSIITEMWQQYAEQRAEAYDKARRMEYQPEENSPRVSSVPGLKGSFADYDKSREKHYTNRLKDFKDATGR